MDLRKLISDNMPQSMKTEPRQSGGGLLPAMAYVVAQPSIAQVYYPETALRQGTLFPELDKPFLGNRGAY